jgi:hypothetical protein
MLTGIHCLLAYLQSTYIYTSLTPSLTVVVASNINLSHLISSHLIIPYHIVSYLVISSLWTVEPNWIFSETPRGFWEQLYGMYPRELFAREGLPVDLGGSWSKLKWEAWINHRIRMSESKYGRKRNPEPPAPPPQRRQGQPLILASAQRQDPSVEWYIRQRYRIRSRLEEAWNKNRYPTGGGDGGNNNDGSGSNDNNNNNASSVASNNARITSNSSAGNNISNRGSSASNNSSSHQRNSHANSSTLTGVNTNSNSSNNNTNSNRRRMNRSNLHERSTVTTSEIFTLV